MKHLHVSEDKIVVVNSGIDERFRPLRTGPRRGYYTVGYVGTLLSPRKRLDYLLTAFHLLKAKHPGRRAKLVLCGDEGGQAVGLRHLTESLGLCQEVEFAGYVPDEKLVETYNSFDVLVLPSDWEGFGFTILEAQRCGVPVIIRKDAHIPSEVSACCLKARSEEDMADQMYQLSTDVELRHRITEQGLEYSQRFTWDRAVQETLRVYDEAMSG
jgi:glycosyltransferase involved in cell wall biosynthesis